MKIQSITNDYKYNQNNIPFKAYIKPNDNFHILYGQESVGLNCKLVKQLNELPNHCIEILKLNRLKNALNEVGDGRESIWDNIECVILNHTTKKVENMILEAKWSPINRLIKGIIELKDKTFFENDMSNMESEMYEVLTTGKSMKKMYNDIIEEI